MKISADSYLPAMLELLRPPSAQPQLSDGGITQQQAPTAEAASAIISPTTHQRDPAEALLALDVWGGVDVGTRSLSASVQPQMSSDQSNAELAENLVDYILAARS